MYYLQRRSQDLTGGGKNYFFQIWKFACREATCWGLGGMPPSEKLFKMVQFDAFRCIFGSNFVFKKFFKLPFFI